MTRQTNIFEGLNIRYFGPVDGHDIAHLTSVLSDLKHIPGPKVLHVITKKARVLNWRRRTKLPGMPPVVNLIGKPD